MALSLSNLAKNLGPDLIKIAEKLKARECEETEVGHFVAFVEEGKNDYDVSVSVTPKGLITGHSCDCGDKLPVCRHKVALLLFLAGGRKSKLVADPKKKESIVEVMFRQAEPENLKHWLLEMFSKNKDLELLFINRFKPSNTQFTPDQVKESTIKAAKSLFKNKKKLEQLELKKIIDLWEELHKPIVNQYLDNVSAPDGFQLFHSILVSIVEISYTWQYTGNNVTKYIKQLFEQSFDAIMALHQFETRQKALLLFVDEIGKMDSPFRYRYLDEILEKMKLLDLATQKVLVEALMAATLQLQKNGIAYRPELLVKMLVLISSQDLFLKYKAEFDFIRHENEYNQLLVKELIQLKEFAKAGEICNMAIESNFQDSYNLPYFDFLKEIYTATSDKKGLLKLREIILPVTFDFEEFIMVYEAMEEGDAKNTFLTRMLTKARASYLEPGETFTIEFLAYEGKFKKMIEYIRHGTPMRMIIKYLEPMSQVGKSDLLSIIFKRDLNRFNSYHKNHEEIKAYPEITRMLLTCYKPDELRQGLARQKLGIFSSQANSPLAEYIEKNLNS